MEPLAEDIERWLAALEETFWCEIANHEIGSTHACRYPSATAARRDMIRQAYAQGLKDAQPPSDFDADVQRVHDLNEANRAANR